MTFEETLAQVRELLERKGRISYRALKLRFNLDGDYSVSRIRGESHEQH
jgi:hypothetical protein